MTSDIEALIETLQAEMKRNEMPEKAVNMSAYLKNRFVCYGIKAPIRNQIQKRWFPEVKKSTLNHWDIVFNLWSLEQRDYHYVAIDLLKRTPKSEIHVDDHRLLEELITTNSWWDSVDSIASNYVGNYFKKFPEMKNSVIESWRNSDDLWLNRTCLIFQLKYKDEVDFELLKDLIKQYQQDKEFFIQKAIGWSLRQYSKFNPKAVADFVEEIQLTGLAKREATKYLK